MNSNSLLMLDRALDHLESMASRDIGEDEFLGTVLQELRTAVDAVAVFAIVPTLDDQWMIRGGCGAIDESDRSRILQQFIQLASSDTQPQLSSESPPWYSHEVSAAWPMLGHLVVVFDKTLTPSLKAGLQEVVRGFCEILTSRQVHLFENFFQHELPAIQSIASDLSGAKEKTEAAALLVNGLSEVFGGSRVSLYEGTGSRDCRMIAISAVASIDAKSPVVKALRAIASKVIEAKQAVVQQGDNAAENEPKGSPNLVLPNYVFFPLATTDKEPIRWILGMEFSKSEALLKSIGKIKLLKPTINLAWKHQMQLLEIPALLQSIFHRKSPRTWQFARLAKFLLVCAAVALSGWWLLSPQTLVIEAEGALRPLESKAIFATADGFVTSVLVQENDRVQVGQPLIKLKSPTLELQIEELQGQFRSLEEEARGIRIAMNQLNASSAEQLSEQSVMASKLTDIEIQQSSLTKQIDILESQNAALEITSPIAGVVSGRELRQNLVGRPVSRGDELFSVMNLDSQWQIKVQVADRDTRYVIDHFSPSSTDGLEVKYVLDSSSEVQHRAKVVEIANRASNIHREGCFVELTANAMDLKPNDLRAGGNVHAYFDCGTKPTWFVWLRPLIESLQRKFWL